MTKKYVKKSFFSSHTGKCVTRFFFRNGRPVCAFNLKLFILFIFHNCNILIKYILLHFQGDIITFLTMSIFNVMFKIIYSSNPARRTKCSVRDQTLGCFMYPYDQFVFLSGIFQFVFKDENLYWKMIQQLVHNC